VASFTLCPICNRPAQPRPANRSYPFCSARCRLLDLSKWLGEEYRIAGGRAGDDDGDDRPPATPDEEKDA
jgi:uncharacterized protein